MSSRLVTGILLDEHSRVSIDDLCSACQVQSEWVFELVEEGVIEEAILLEDIYFFTGHDLSRIRIVKNLQNDLGVNIAGAALALELMDELESLRK